MISTLVLNNKQIKGHNLQITALFPLRSEDASGKSSKTTRVESGDKAKSISVNLAIKYDNTKDLSDLMALAEAKSTANERVIYNVLNRTANALNIRQVQFDDDVRITEHESLQLWNVSFTLAEYHSVAEKKQDRVNAKDKPIAIQKAKGKTVAKTTVASSTTTNKSTATTTTTPTTAPSNPTPAAPKKSEPLTGFEGILKKADDYLKNKK